MGTVSRTSLSVAAQRAIESERPQALFHDPYARDLAGKEGFRVADELAALSYLPMSPEFPGMFAVRTRFYDDGLMAAIQNGIRQVVVIAAGMDTRACRLELPPDTHVFEIDREETFGHKEPILAGLGATPRCHRQVVATDLRDAWPERLVEAGFVPTHCTVWIVEGLLYYLTESEVIDLLEETLRLCPSGSVLYTDVAPTAMRELDQLKGWRDAMDALGEPWQFFTDDGAALLAAHGWDATATSVPEVADLLGAPLAPGAASTARRLLSATRSHAA
jgi:methyltransferase (TIGR00027 family)